VVDSQQNALALGPAGVFYVMWLGNSLSKYTTTGEFVAQWGTQGTNAGQFNEAQGLAVDTNGNVYVADSANNRIQMFDPNGNFLVQWGKTGTNAGEFELPCRVAVTPSGSYVYVADTFNNRIQVFSFLPGFLAADPSSNSAGFAIEVSGLGGYSYIVQASSNLLDWVSLQTNVVPFTFVDTNSAGSPCHFYRTLLSP
jgi:DNA-binding beta-propeller fold protein YncE